MWGPGYLGTGQRRVSICWAVLPSGPSEGAGGLRILRPRGCCPRKSAGWCVSAESAAAVEGKLPRENTPGRKPPCRVCERRVGVLCPLSPRFPLTAPGCAQNMSWRGPLNKQPGWVMASEFIYRASSPARRLSGLLSRNQVGRKTRPPKPPAPIYSRKPLNVNGSSPTRAWSEPEIEPRPEILRQLLLPCWGCLLDPPPEGPITLQRIEQPSSTWRL